MTANDLKPFCGGTWCGEPFAVQDNNGDWWTVATDGKHALCVRGDHSDAPPPDTRFTETCRYIAGQIAGSGGTSSTVAPAITLSKLRDWCGAYDPGVKGTRCEACDGAGEQECPTCYHVGDCDRCHGRGVIGRRYPKDRHGLLFGLTVDMNRLAWLLTVMPGEAVQVTATTEKDPVIFRTPDMVVLLMPMTNRDRVLPLPSFPAN